ncbi:MAG TPA: hypothetical protein VKA94_03565, partial [Hyphomicrobiales bacterium]|nr:hypothetical protein [Hyphomicrobiales bacterium]
REWLARAVRASRDPVWMADGVIFSEWQPISPITGRLDAFEWRVPPDRSEKGDGKDLLDEFAALSRDMESAALPGAGDGGEEQAEGPVTITIPANQTDARPEAEAEAEAVEADEVRSDSKAMVIVTEPVADDAASEEAEIVETEDVEAFGVQSDQEEAVMAAKTEPGNDETAETAAQTEKPQRKPPKEPNIFVPGRAPDDPGPENIDYDDDGSTPYKRYRDGLKTQTS